MSTEEEYWHLLEHYALNELSDKTREEVEAWLAKNEDAQTTLAGIRAMIDDMPDELEREKFHREQIDTNVAVYASDKKEEKKRFSSLWVAAASLVIIATISFLFFSSDDTLEEKLNDYIAQPYALSDQVRSSDIETQDWISAYNNSDFNIVIETLAGKDSLISDERLYLGLSYLYNGQNNLAIERLQMSFNSPYLDPQRKWYLALTYLKNEQMELAQPLLRELSNEKSFMHSEAQELLRLLDE